MKPKTSEPQSTPALEPVRVSLLVCAPALRSCLTRFVLFVALAIRPLTTSARRRLPSCKSAPTLRAVSLSSMPSACNYCKRPCLSLSGPSMRTLDLPLDSGRSRAWRPSKSLPASAARTCTILGVPATCPEMSSTMFQSL